MIRHCVLCRFMASVDKTLIDELMHAFEQLPDTIDGLHSVTAGANISPEGQNHGFDQGFIMDFDDVAARDAYLSHPAHKALATRMVKELEGGAESGVIVFDIDLGSVAAGN